MNFTSGALPAEGTVLLTMEAATHTGPPAASQLPGPLGWPGGGGQCPCRAWGLELGLFASVGGQFRPDSPWEGCLAFLSCWLMRSEEEGSQGVLISSMNIKIKNSLT